MAGNGGKPWTMLEIAGNGYNFFKKMAGTWQKMAGHVLNDLVGNGLKLLEMAENG